MKNGMVKESMEPILGPNMVRYDAFLSEHETDTHKHQKNELKKHSAGHAHHMDHVEKMCGGGKA